MKKAKSIYAALITLLLFVLLTPQAMADGDSVIPDVEILLDGSADTSATSDQTIAVQLDIIFHNKSWYNDRLYLSYHIYNPEGELLLFEGERTLIENGSGGEVRNFPIVLNLADFSETRVQKDVMVTFDIVDEGNSFWFSYSPEMSFRAASVRYNGHFPARMKSVILKMFYRLPIFLLNIAACVLFAVGCFFYRRSRDVKVLSGPFCQEGDQSLDRSLYERYFTASHYAGHGCLVYFRDGAEGGDALAPFTRFFEEGLRWKAVEASDVENDLPKKIDLCMFSGQEDVLPFLLSLERKGIFPKVVCFSYQWTDYDTLMAWSHKNHYRYDFRSFDFACIKRLNWVERMIY